MKSKKTFLLFFLLPAALFFYSCGTQDTVRVIENVPRPGTDTTAARPAGEQTPQENGQFQQLTIGIIEPVSNFDPLFAEYLSAQRVLSLIYEGLFTLDENGEPAPVIADSVGVSDDGLEYTITINRDIFYHQSNVFTSGLGRRIHAADIKWAFERAAGMDVPDDAARLLMNITGYENYYLEQRQIYDPDLRVLEEVNGIQVLNPETIYFRLNREDPDFLKKLASPFLYIYPREAILRSEPGLKSQPVGTGPFRLRQTAENERLILVKNQPENTPARTNLPRLDRVDIVPFGTEAELLEQFREHNVDWIPETPPFVLQELATREYSLLPAYEEDYGLTRSDGSRITSVFLNENSIAASDWLKGRIDLVTEEDFGIWGEYSLQSPYSESSPPPVDSGTVEPDSSYYIAYTDNMTARRLYDNLHTNVLNFDTELVFFDIRVPARETVFYSSVTDSFHNSQTGGHPSEPWLRLQTPIIGLYHSYISGIQPATAPWLLNLNAVRVNLSERDAL